MVIKSLKFRPFLATEILEGRKDVTWRLFDDKDLRIGDKINLINWETGEKFGEAEIIELEEKPMKELNETDYIGHEKFGNHEEMMETYQKYYGDKVNSETLVKIIKFKLLQV